MSLKAKLAKIRETAERNIPEQVWAVMGRKTQELRDSGIMDSVIKVGDPLPAFTLANANGEEVKSRDLLAKGPLVLTIFRGHW